MNISPDLAGVVALVAGVLFVYAAGAPDLRRGAMCIGLAVLALALALGFFAVA